MRPASTLDYNAYQVWIALKLFKVSELPGKQKLAIRTICKDFAPKTAHFEQRPHGYAGSGWYAVAPAYAWQVWMRDYERGGV